MVSAAIAYLFTLEILEHSRVARISFFCPFIYEKNCYYVRFHPPIQDWISGIGISENGSYPFLLRTANIACDYYTLSTFASKYIEVQYYPRLTAHGRLGEKSNKGGRLTGGGAVSRGGGVSRG